jgi:taurine dioxygenase
MQTISGQKAATRLPSVTPFANAFGAKISDADVRTLDERGLEFVRDALLRYSVIVISGQTLEPADQLEFLDRIYPVRRSGHAVGKINPYALPDHPEVLIISNIKNPDGTPIGMTDAGLLWHTDTCFEAFPELFVSLYALIVPEDDDGQALGNTVFRSTTAAYDALPDTERRRLDGLRIVQSYAAHLERMRAKGILTRTPVARPDIVHPLIRTHAITGRKGIYVNESFSSHVEGMDRAESDELLEMLYAQVARPEFSLTHTWAKGDFVIWDNSVTQHKATFDYGDRPRRMHRASTTGPAPE